MSLALAIDIGGTNTKIALVNKEGVIIKRTHFPTWIGKTKNAFFDQLFNSVNEICSEEDLEEVEGIGLDAPSCSPEQGICLLYTSPSPRD